ncbi:MULTISPECIES: hypothetical protein [unclassified Amycolatopsis]|uniref:hypothetical protein n=1 Tax=unclassified Amycolatopsis TaxID=2618356 RepID=UPI002875741F|nr:MULTISPECIES: hypothetical protein [unclassified Amycolatopsis]MDS0139490.1 hypothetical protein [Amycolatopsis sp. 505]MDS0147069.1 hypothetical protein [Amycolatopsis sp. CM201R]
MRKISKRSAIVLGAAGAVVVAGVAYAAWTSTGSGTGSVSSTTSVNSTITPAGSGSALYPGGGTDFTVTVDNPNSYPVVVTGISAGSSNAVNGCAAGTVTSAVPADTTGTIAAGGSKTYTLHATMNANATDACKSQTFVLPLTATLASNAS